MSTLVSVGNCYQPFHRLLNEVTRLAHNSCLPGPIRIQNGHTELDAPHCQLTPFLSRTQFEEFLEQATLVIAHAGAGTVLQAVHAGKVPVVMPRLSRFGEHVDDHQVELAQTLAAGGRVIVANTPDDLHGAILLALQKQRTAPQLPVTSASTALLEHVRNILEAWNPAAKGSRTA